MCSSENRVDFLKTKTSQACILQPHPTTVRPLTKDVRLTTFAQTACGGFAHQARYAKLAQSRNRIHPPLVKAGKIKPRPPLR